MTPMTFDQFVINVTARNASHDERMGQSFFNLLALVKPNLAEAVRGSVIDPFYLSAVPGRTIEFVRNAWED